ncbi:MAG: glycosyltransferase family 1 protein [Desulfuromonadaceae bacterium]|nr:glycosyltransferase family 1 protein [Desulfuromonadaceae bacterium]MDD2854117.1 glycosyltransferase family 1 protein [Desulfuromonadaceae bacterium]
MKIAYDAQIFFEQPYGGVSRYFCEIAKRISAYEDLQVSITAPMHINAYLEHLPPHIVSGFRLPYADKISLTVRGIGMLIGDMMLRSFSPNVIHETYYFPYRLGPSSARRVLTMHDMIHEKFADDFEAGDRTARFKSMSVERSDHIICVSENTRNDLIELLGVQPDKTSVIYHGFDLMDYATTARTETVIDFGEPFILYVGNRGRYKNFLSLLKAYAESKELTGRCRLVCFGSEKFNDTELKLIEKMGLNRNRVVPIGGGDHILAALYKSALVFVYPSLYEGFGIPPLEAMSFGCPVVCSNEGSIPEVVGDAGEYFDPKNIDNIRDAIERVVDSETIRRELIKKGKERTKIFSWERCAKETAEIYRKLL